MGVGILPQDQWFLVVRNGVCVPRVDVVDIGGEDIYLEAQKFLVCTNGSSPWSAEDWCKADDCWGGSL